MKQLYPDFSVRLKKSLLLSMFFLAAFYASGQVYTTRLTGPNEPPVNSVPNTSPGIGTATVTVVGTSMRVETTYSGLVAVTSAGQPSGTTASHIHATTAIAGVGTAGVATPVPTFPGFPGLPGAAGVRMGTYDRTFDMTLASSYNPAFLTANGGTPTSTLTAFAALKAALDAGKAYLNIHSTAYPGGEIRGFLVRCPTINIAIPDAFALAQGTLPNSVYPAYPPAASLTLAATVTGGTSPYTYSWSNGSTASSITVTPTANAQYTLTVQGQNGCPSTTETKTVNVVNISGGNKGDKIVICHKEKNSLTIAASAVDDHLQHGDMLGGYGEQSDKKHNVSTEDNMEQPNDLSVKVLPNPSPNYFDLQINGKADENVQVRVYDMLGRVIDLKSMLRANQTLRVGSAYQPGTYVLQVSQGAQKRTLQLIKTK